MASWLVRSFSDRAVLVGEVAWDIVLCYWAKHFSFTVTFSTQVYKKGTGELNAERNPAMD